MKTVCKIGVFLFTLGLPGVAGAAELPAEAKAQVDNFATAVNKIKCTNAQTQAACNSCHGEASNIFEQLKKSVGGTTAQTVAANVGGQADIGRTAKDGTRDGAQQGQVLTAQQAAEAAKKAQAQKQTAALSAKQAFEKCVSQMGQVCSAIGDPDQANADAAKKACEDGAKAAEKVAEEKKGSGTDLGQLAQLLGTAAQALGPLLQKQPETPTDMSPFTNTPSTVSAAKDAIPPNAATSSLGTSPGSSALGFGKNPTGTSIKAAANEVGAFSPSGSSSYPGYRDTQGPTLAAALGGSDTGKGMNASSPSLAGGAGGSGSFGSGARDGSGASAMGAVPGAGAGAGEEGYEIPGGGGGRPFLGLKSKGGDLGELGGSSDLGSGVLGDIGTGERDLASSEENAGINEEEGGNLFEVIHSKYGEIKRRGSI